MVCFEPNFRPLDLKPGDTVKVEASVGLAAHQNPCWTGSVEFALPPADTAKEELPVLRLRRCPKLPKRIRCVVTMPDGTRVPKRELGLDLRKAAEEKSGWFLEKNDVDPQLRFHIVADGVGEIWLPGNVLDDAFEVEIDSLVSWPPGNVPFHNPTLEFVPSELTDGTVEYRLNPKTPSVELVLTGQDDVLDWISEEREALSLYEHNPPPEGFFTGGKPRWDGETREWRGNPKRMREDGVLIERFWTERAWGWFEHVKVLSGENKGRRSHTHEKLIRGVFPHKTEEGDLVFKFYGLPEGEYRLSEPSELKFALRFIQVPGAEKGTVRREVVVTKRKPVERIELRGRVLDEDDRPVRSAYVRLAWPGGVGNHHVTSGEDGTFSVEKVPAKEIELRARKKGYDTVRRSVDAKEFRETEVVLRLHRLPRVTGRVTDERGRPVKKALVSLLKFRETGEVRNRWKKVEIKETDSQGRFDLLAEEGPGPHALVAREPRLWGRTVCEQIVVAPDGNRQSLSLSKGKPVSIKLRTERDDSTRTRHPKNNYCIHVYNKKYPPLAFCGGGNITGRGRLKLSLAPGKYAAIVFVEVPAHKRRDSVPDRIKPVPQHSALSPTSFEVKEGGTPEPIMLTVPADWEKKTIYTGGLTDGSLPRLWYSEHCKWWQEELGDRR